MRLSLLFLAFLGVACAADDTVATVGWETASAEPAKIAIPKGWRSRDGIKATMPLFRQGDGIGVPAVDETGAPLQIGITVERFPPAEQSIETIASELAKGATKNPQLEIVGKETVEAVRLFDDTQATLLTMEFLKNVNRRSLQMKLIAKDGKGEIWIVSGFLVGSRDSQWLTANSRLGSWLRAHVTSLTLTSKDVDSKSLEAAYQKRD